MSNIKPPHDTARCQGVRVAALCQSCLRRSQGRNDGPQTYITPMVFDAEVGIEQCPNHIHEQKKGLTPQQAFKRIAAVTSMLILTACGGGGWEEDCKAHGGELVTNEAGDLVCMTNNRLPALPGPGQGG